MWIFILGMLLKVALLQSKEFSDTQSKCIFKQSYKIICKNYATFEDLYEISKRVSVNNITSVEFINAYIPIIPSFIFEDANLQSLNEIIIHNSQTHTIEENAFYALRDMKILTIQANKINALLQNQFNNMKNLLHLNLDGNEIENIPAYAFTGLNSLIDLSLKNNRIKKLKRNSMQIALELTNLDLRNSSIESIEAEAFGFLSSIQFINLQDNKIMRLPSGSFSGINEVEYLNLSHQSIEVIENEFFRGVNTLKILDLSHNKIKNLTRGSFDNLYNLKVLDLLENHNIKFIESGTFRHLKNLQTLRLPKYCFQQIRLGFFTGLKHMVSLDLSHAGIYEILPNSWDGLVSLTHLNLSKNFLRKIEYNYFIPSLQKLYLRNNRITTLARDAFSEIRTLRLLDLSHNQLTQISTTVLQNLIFLELFDIHSNQIVDVNFEAFTCKLNRNNLKKVILNGNKWSCDRLSVILSHFDLFNIKYNLNEKMSVPTSNKSFPLSVHCNGRQREHFNLVPKGRRTKGSACKDVTVTDPVVRELNVSWSWTDHNNFVYLKNGKFTRFFDLNYLFIFLLGILVGSVATNYYNFLKTKNHYRKFYENIKEIT